MRRSLSRRPDGQPVPSGNPYPPRRLLPADLAAQLRHARWQQGLSLAEAARMAGVSKGYLSRLERGLRAPRRAVAGRLIGVLDLDPEVAERLLDEVADEWAGRAG